MFIWKKSNKSSPFRQMKYTSIPKKHSCQRRCCTSINNIKVITYTHQNSSCSTTCTGRNNKPGCKLNTKSPICCTDADADGSGCKDQNNICGIGGDVSLCERTVLSCSGGDADEWDGWATSTHYTDTTPFCGDFSNIDYHVAVPWNILCKEFSTKNCLVNHMCPNCAKCGSAVDALWNNTSTGTDCSPGCSKKKCGGIGPMQTTSCISGNERNTCMNTPCPNVLTHNKGVNEFGICWEVQPLQDLGGTPGGNISKYKSGESFPLYNYTKGINIANAIPISDKIYTVKLHNGCGGNCQGNNSSCKQSSDCVNGCIGASTQDPCMITNTDNACNFMSTIYKKYDFQIRDEEAIEMLRNISGGTCPLPFDAKDGQFYKSDGFPNWCSGANMHFDFNTSDPDGIPFVSTHRLIRYRRIKCPAYPDGCSTKTSLG